MPAGKSFLEAVTQKLMPLKCRPDDLFGYVFIFEINVHFCCILYLYIYLNCGLFVVWIAEGTEDTEAAELRDFLFLPHLLGKEI